MIAAQSLRGTEAPTSSVERSAGQVVLRLRGAWITERIGKTETAIERIETGDADAVEIDLDKVEVLDTAGAQLLYGTLKHLRDRGLRSEIVNATPAMVSLLKTIAENDIPLPDQPPRSSPIIAVVLRLGTATVWALREARDLVNFLGLTIIVLLRLVLKPARIRGTALISHMEQTGLNALPIIGLISFLIGVVLAYQGADQLAQFGAQIFTVNLVGIGVLREMGILLTAIMVAGRSGSAFTAQIGTMKVNEEIDAMRTIGLDPMEVLVAPRVLALILVMPLLTFYADVMGILGGAVMANAVLDISFFQFARQLSDTAPLWSFWIGLIKAPIFAFIIGLVGCYEGLQVSRSAESVGRQTTRAVVEAVFLVIVLDALFSILFSVLGV